MAKAPKVLILNGPNLNMLGKRQPDVYGRESLSDVEESCRRHGQGVGLEVDFRQSNSEGTLVDWIQEARETHDAVIINPAAYTHTSVAIMDALLAAELPVIEVHLSNIHRREAFRHQSYVSKVADAVLCGFGTQGYLLALDAMARRLNSQQET
ncbi:MAG: type II 3-dehydroquinate dehydratase [Kiloniellaceae bacterium]